MTTDAPDQHVYDEIIDNLAYKYDGVFAKEAVAAAVAQARQDLGPPPR